MRNTDSDGKTSPTTVELAGALQVVAERLLDDDPAPGARRATRRARSA
jgi:hypothetical protein